MSDTNMDLYDTDFFAWTQQQAEAIRAGVWGDIDRDATENPYGST